MNGFYVLLLECWTRPLSWMAQNLKEMMTWIAFPRLLCQEGVTSLTLPMMQATCVASTTTHENDAGAACSLAAAAAATGS